ncbi:MAG TPA: hypothetical protein VMT12_16395 [Syntrophales bacterium]|nr:hypothetical protein [Syntrophales bacterium]
MSKKCVEISDTVRKQRKRVVDSLLVFGMVLIGLSILLTLLHYLIDRQLGEEEEKFRLYGLDVVNYHISDQSTVNTSFMILLGTEMVPKYKRLDYFKEHFYVQNIETLCSLHRVLFGEDADPALVQTWKKLTNWNEYQDEKKKMFDKAILFKDDKSEGRPSRFGKDLLDRIKSMKKWKDCTMTSAIILQVIGLSLNQIAIIKKNN